MNCSPTPLNIQKKYSSQTLLEAKAKPLTYSDIFGEIRNPGSIKAPSPQPEPEIIADEASSEKSNLFGHSFPNLFQINTRKSNKPFDPAHNAQLGKTCGSEQFAALSNNVQGNNRQQSSDRLVTNNTNINANNQETLNNNQTDHTSYISSFNTRRNPDLLIPGGPAMKGNAYFKSNISLEEQKPHQQNEQLEDGETVNSPKNNHRTVTQMKQALQPIDEHIPESQEEEIDVEEDCFKKLKQQTVRYYQEDNPTLKCRNCKQFGHLARDCCNERRGASCILCGSLDHDSHECTEKLCFKCNKVGHKATECLEKNIETCTLCNLVGHGHQRCLKVWNQGMNNQQQGRFTVKQLNHARCMECSHEGHLRCTSDRKAYSFQVSFSVKDNLDEFIRPPEWLPSEKSEKKKERKERRLSNTNIVVPTSDSEDAFDDGQSDQSDDSQMNDQDFRMGCASCGMKGHDVMDCQYRGRGNQKYKQYENVRAKFAKEVGFNYKNKGSSYGTRDQTGTYTNNSSYNTNNGYNSRLGSDPRLKNNSYNQRDDYRNNNTNSYNANRNQQQSYGDRAGNNDYSRSRDRYDKNDHVYQRDNYRERDHHQNNNYRGGDSNDRSSTTQKYKDQGKHIAQNDRKGVNNRNIMFDNNTSGDPRRKNGYDPRRDLEMNNQNKRSTSGTEGKKQEKEQLPANNNNNDSSSEPGHIRQNSKKAAAPIRQTQQQTKQRLVYVAESEEEGACGSSNSSDVHMFRSFARKADKSMKKQNDKGGHSRYNNNSGGNNHHQHYQKNKKH